MPTISISKGNSKLGQIPSVSLPAVTTCRACACAKICYAKKLERLRPTVRKAYQRNLDALIHHPDTYWREVEAAIMMSRFFRFHVSGDIPHYDYLVKMAEIAARNTHCEILCFTKRYEFVNHFVDAGNTIPPNLHIIFSDWPGTTMDNPYHFPVAYVRFRDGSTQAPSGAQECGGNCSECACTEGGCWSLKYGEAVVFNEH